MPRKKQPRTKGEPRTYVCFATGKEKHCPTGVPPHKWRADSKGNWYCPEAWAERYYLQYIVMPVAEPIGNTWSEFEKVLFPAFAASTSLMNFVTTELAKIDFVRHPTDKEMPKLPNHRQSPFMIFTYHAAKSMYPVLSTYMISTLIREAISNYKANRLATHWYRTRSLASYKYPHPINNEGRDSFTLSAGDNHFIVTMRFGSDENARRWSFRLRGGSKFERQHEMLRRLIEDKTIRKPGIMLYEIPANKGDRRGGYIGKDGKRARLMVRIAAWLPVEPNKPAEGANHKKILQLATCPDIFWKATADWLEKPWVFRSDWIKSFEMEHHRQARQIKVATTKEQNRKRMNRVRSFAHVACKTITQFAVKNGVTEIHYDDFCRSHMPSFLWFDLFKMLEVKLSSKGIGLVKANKDNDLAADTDKVA